MISLLPGAPELRHGCLLLAQAAADDDGDDNLLTLGDPARQGHVADNGGA